MIEVRRTCYHLYGRWHLCQHVYYFHTDSPIWPNLSTDATLCQFVIPLLFIYKMFFLMFCWFINSYLRFSGIKEEAGSDVETKPSKKVNVVCIVFIHSSLWLVWVCYSSWQHFCRHSKNWPKWKWTLSVSSLCECVTKSVRVSAMFHCCQ